MRFTDETTEHDAPRALLTTRRHRSTDRHDVRAAQRCSYGHGGVSVAIARPQGLSVDEVLRAGVAHHPRPGAVALLGSGLFDRTWNPSSDGRPTAWEAVHHLADRLIDGGGVVEAARLMNELGAFRDPAQALVYRLHDIAARKGWASDQERYNFLISSWPDLLAEGAKMNDGLF